MKQLKLFFLLFALMLSVSANAVIQEGSCGDNVTFVLNDDGTLVISGTGAMLNYANHFFAPWYSNKSQILKLSIGDGVTRIGHYAFYYCSSLTSVTIPNSVTSIGNCAFWGCSGLTSVNIPNSVTSIRNYAFYDCSGLTSVTIGNSVTSIGYNAFEGCSGLTSVTIPNSVTSIGGSAFSGCSKLTSVTIPNSVTSIGSSAFNGCSGLTSITIPKSVTSIGSNAFQNCSGLTSITIPKSVTSIGTYAFYGCSGLTSVTVDSDNPNYCSDDNVIYTKDKSTLVYCMTSKKGDFVIPNSVTSIGNHAFYDCSGLTSVTIPNSVTSIGNHAFEYCSSLTSVNIPNSVTSIGDAAFRDCSGLTSVTIPNSVTSIGWDAFEGCYRLTSVNINDIETWCKIKFNGGYSNPLYYANNLYLNNTLVEDLVIPNSVTSIGDYAFYDCDGLTSITFPNSVTSIGDYAFYDCDGLTSITFPYSVTSIGSCAFKDCNYLQEIHSNNLTHPQCSADCFSGVHCKLYVPIGSKEDYQVADEWRNFATIIEENTLNGIVKPSITIKDNTIYINSNNANAKYFYTLQATDAVSSFKEAENGSVSLTGTYIVTAYAKTDDETSEAATATFNFPLEKEVEKEVEVFIYDDTHANIDLPTGERVTIEIREGIVTIKSLPINSTVYVYTEGGELWETRRVNSASLTLDLPRHSVYIIKTSGKTFKVKI